MEFQCLLQTLVNFNATTAHMHVDLTFWRCFFRKMQLCHEHTELSMQFKLLTFNLSDWFVASDTLLF